MIKAKKTATLVTATALSGIMAFGMVVTPAGAAESAPAVVTSQVNMNIPDVFDDVDIAAVIASIPGMDELKASFIETERLAVTAYGAVQKAETSVAKASKDATVVRTLATAPIPTSVRDAAERVSELQVAVRDASDSFTSAKTDVDAAYSAVVSIRVAAKATIATAVDVRVTAEAVLRDPSVSPATREAAMDALAVIGANIAENEQYVAIATSTLAKVDQVKAAAAKAQKAIEDAKAASERVAGVEKAISQALATATAKAKQAVSAAKDAVQRALPFRG
jgi:hypothetical protein